MSEKTVEAWRNLWFHTGDRVVRDADGYFRFVDRLKDAIRRRGENISSYEVEQVLLSHPLIETAAIYPVKSELAEDEVMAAIVVRPGAALLEVDLMRFCETRMAYSRVPRYVEFIDHELRGGHPEGLALTPARTTRCCSAAKPGVCGCGRVLQVPGGAGRAGRGSAAGHPFARRWGHGVVRP